MKALYQFQIKAALMGIAVPVTVFAESGASEDNSGFFVWIFLGFLALIVVAQLVPAILLMFGMAKGIKSVVKEEKSVVK